MDIVEFVEENKRENIRQFFHQNMYVVVQVLSVATPGQ